MDKRLMTCLGALLILIGYLALRLIGHHRLLNEANLALQAENEELERRLAESTREPAAALREP